MPKISRYTLYVLSAVFLWHPNTVPAISHGTQFSHRWCEVASGVTPGTQTPSWDRKWSTLSWKIPRHPNQQLRTGFRCVFSAETALRLSWGYWNLWFSSYLQRGEFPLQSSSSARHCHHQWPQEDSRHDPTENPQQPALLQCCLVMGSKMRVAHSKPKRLSVCTPKI